MTYRQLNETTLIDYLKSTASLASLVTAHTQAKEVGDGNINFVYIVEGLKDGKKLVIKQAVPYLRILGENFSLSKERMHFESLALQNFSTLSPKHVPEIYHVDDEMSLVVMQCLDEHIIMRKGLIAEKTYPNFAEHITDFMANALFKTSDFYLSGKAKRTLMKNYVSNHELCKITEDFVFSTPYMTHETNPENKRLAEEILTTHQDENFKLEALKLKNKFMHQTDALLHGDLHTGSIMVNETDTFVIDAEFAFFGPIGFDVGAVIANLLLAWISHFERSKDRNYQHWILETALEVYSGFEKKFLALWDEYSHKENGMILKDFCSEHLLKRYQKFYMHEVLQDTLGFAGLKMARRILGIAGVADIRDIPDLDARTRAEKLSLAIAKQLVLKRQTIHSIAEILPILEKESASYAKT